MKTERLNEAVLSWMLNKLVFEVKNVMYFNDFKILAWSPKISKNIWKDMFRNALNTGISRNKFSNIFVGQKIKIKPRVSQFSL